MPDTVRKPTCSGCPHDLYYSDRIPQKQFGVMMHMGERFCTGGKRARKFKGHDPKIYVPSWCPKRKSPCEVRIYTLKSAFDWFLHSKLNHDLNGAVSPSAHSYALRVQTHTELTPQEFWKRYNSEPLEKLFDIPVRNYDVVEIDDGLAPAFFYKADGDYSILGLFDAELAKKNKLEDCD